MYHANFSFLIEAFQKICPSVPADLLHELVCDTNTHDCMLGGCSNCSILSAFDNFVAQLSEDMSADEMDGQVSYEQWFGCTKQVFYGSFENICKSLRELVVPFAHHCFIKRQQSIGYLIKYKLRYGIAPQQKTYKK
jgi:hypothetical protein